MPIGAVELQIKADTKCRNGTPSSAYMHLQCRFKVAAGQSASSMTYCFAGFGKSPVRFILLS